MKKIVVVALALLMAATGLHAQEAGTFTLGFRTGVAFGFHDTGDSEREMRRYIYHWYGYHSSIDSSRRMNFNLAAFAGYTIIDNLSLQLELGIMANQGFRMEATAQGVDAGEAQFSYTSLDIPLLVRYSFLDGMLGVMAGPHISIPLGRAVNWIEPAANNEHDYGYAFEIDTFATFGFTTGVVGAFPVGPGHIIGDLRFVFDFNSMQVVTEHPTIYGRQTSIDAITRRALVFTVGYQMSF